MRNFAIIDSLPILVVFLLTVALIVLSVEVGYRIGMARARKSEREREAPIDSMVGSTLGLHHVLRAAGVESVASFPSPFVVAPHYRELPGLELLTPPDLVDREPEVLVTFDCGALDRLGDLDTCAKGAAELIVVDHHASNERYGTINVIDLVGKLPCAKAGALAIDASAPTTSARKRKFMTDAPGCHLDYGAFFLRTPSQGRSARQ